MKYGQYSFHFARNESARAYVYGRDPVVAFEKTDKHSIPTSKSNSISLRPYFKAFQDCIKMTNDLYQAYNKKELERSINCEIVRENVSAASLINLKNVSLE